MIQDFKPRKRIAARVSVRDKETGITESRECGGRLVRQIAVAAFADKVAQHPDKTFIGRIGRGFCFLGDAFNEVGLVDVAPHTNEKHAKRIREL